MNKLFISILVFILLLGIVLFLIRFGKPSDTINELLSLNNIHKEIDYFNISYLNRYINYKNKYPHLSDVDVITRVNIGLDKEFYNDTVETNYKDDYSILVNKYNYLESDYIPNNLIEINSKYSVGGIEVVDIVNSSFERLCEDAYVDGYVIRAVSAYRSYNYQDNLYQGYVLNDGVEKADLYSARAGYSEHQTGLAIDVDNDITSYTRFRESKEFEWMIENAYKYGFILRYPLGKEMITGYQFEAWHYRYVGVEIATYIYKHNITFDEYYVRFIQ